MRFDGKVCLITGAGSGIGRATAIGFARQGGQVAVTDVNGDSAAEVTAEIAAFSGSATSIVADMANAADIDAMVARTVEQFGQLDVLHNNAFGVPATLRQSRLARSAEIDQAVWDYTIQVGLTAVMQAIRAALPIMQRQGGGAIVNTASISGTACRLRHRRLQRDEGRRGQPDARCRRRVRAARHSRQLRLPRGD
jgi:NAD(P)-dependent dehydrogenase (short-subunit alcohol dehydrogenase family)